jgi:hypothetical protein
MYPEFPRISMGMKLNIFIYCKWYFCVSYEREIGALITDTEICILPVPKINDIIANVMVSP